MKKLFLFALMLSFYGCVLPVNYDMSMDPSTGTIAEYSTYRDDNGLLFTWSWRPFQSSSGYAPVVTIKNQSEQTVQIVWSNCVLVENGRPYPIYDTNTVAVEDVKAPLKDTIIPPNATTKFVIARLDNVYDSLNVALARPILAGTGPAVKRKGESLMLYILADLDGTRYNYRFNFTVEDVD
ncbi:MAG: hypothetical protein LBV04_08540 [Deferribacteraceae bacterium]|jgi:hypothetical protein|nr:hypothetical protein [Deferribacteraceae bacterium]